MKFSIARTTVTQVFNGLNECEGLNELNVPSDELLAHTDRLANISIRGENEQIVVEVNDEIVLRYLALYVKTYKLVMPIVTAVVGMWGAVQSLIKADCEELVAFIKARKE